MNFVSYFDTNFESNDINRHQYIAGWFWRNKSVSSEQWDYDNKRLGKSSGQMRGSENNHSHSLESQGRHHALEPSPIRGLVPFIQTHIERLERGMGMRGTWAWVIINSLFFKRSCYIPVRPCCWALSKIRIVSEPNRRHGTLHSYAHWEAGEGVRMRGTWAWVIIDSLLFMRSCYILELTCCWALGTTFERFRAEHNGKGSLSLRTLNWTFYFCRWRHCWQSGGLHREKKLND